VKREFLAGKEGMRINFGTGGVKFMNGKAQVGADRQRVRQRAGLRKKIRKHTTNGEEEKIARAKKGGKKLSGPN